MNDWKKKGWVRLYRSIEDNPFYFIEPFTKAQAWIDLFLNANHTNNIISIRGNIIHLKRGQIGWSELTMSKRWKWSKGRTRRFLKLLETEQQIEQQKDRYITTIITILNYGKYQNDTADDTADGQQTDSRRYLDKNDKNEKNEKKLGAEAPPTPKEKNISFFEDDGIQKKAIAWAVENGAADEEAELEIKKFVLYWTEPNSTGKKLRWQMQKTFDVKRRLATWLMNSKKFSGERPLEPMTDSMKERMKI